MKKYLKVFAIFLILSIIFLIFLITGVILYDTTVFNLFLALFLVTLAAWIITAVCLNIRDKKAEKNKNYEMWQLNKEKEKENRKQEEIKREQFIKRDINYGLYASPVYNFIEKVLKENGSYFYFNSCFWYPSDGNKLLSWLLERDGFNNSKNFVPHTICELTEILAKGVEDRLPEDTEDKPAAAYLIIRNNIIKYFRNKHIENMGYVDVPSLCNNISKPSAEQKVLFAYYYIYETDITLPLTATYKALCRKMLDEYEAIRKKGIENSLFQENPRAEATAEDSKDVQEKS